MGQGTASLFWGGLDVLQSTEMLHAMKVKGPPQG